MIIQTNYNIGRLISYQKFYRKVNMPLSFFFKTPLPCFASYSLTNFCLLALKDDSVPKGRAGMRKGLCWTVSSSTILIFATVSPLDHFAPPRVGLLLLQGAKFTRGIPTDHSDSRSDKVRHKKYLRLKIIFLSYRSSRGWILANIDHHPTIN